MRIACRTAPIRYASDVDDRKGNGVLVFADGKISGGGGGFDIVGSYTNDGGSLAAELTAQPRDGGGSEPPVFGSGRVSFTLSGAFEGGRAHLKGSTRHDHGINVEAVLQPRTD